MVHYDVVVVGGGLAGLTAASLVSAGGKSVCVLESRDRVGGRTSSLVLNDTGIRFDEGGQWVGPHQHHILQLAKQMEVDTFLQTHEGKTVKPFSVFSCSGLTCLTCLAVGIRLELQFD